MAWGALIGAAISYASQPSGSGNYAGMADPFASQRPQYQQQLQQLMAGNIQADPSYNFRLKTGTENVNRGLASSGQLGSGLQQEQLQQFGQELASQEYQAQFDRLSSLAGVSAGSPVSAANLAMAQRNQQAAGAGILGKTAWDALSKYYSAPASVTTPTASPDFSIPSGYALDPYGYAQTPSGETLSF